MKAATKRLGDIAAVFNGKTPSKAEQRDAGFPVLKIKDVSETGQFRGTFASFVDESLANKHSARWVHSGDTLILNAAHNADYVASKMFFAGADVTGALPTGEWLLVRPNTTEAVPEFLHYWLRSSDAKKAVRFLVKGIHLYPKDVAELSVPWFSLPEQRRIVDILSRAEGIVRLRREAEKKAAELIPALFLDMFGDPATNPKGFPTKAIKDICDLVRGSSPRPQGDSRYFGGPVPRLMIADITRDGVYVFPKIDSLTVEGAKKSRPMKTGEVVMAVSGAVGLPAILSVDACIHDGFVGFRSLSDEVSSEYFYNFLAAYRHLSIGQAVGATFQNLKTDQVREWLVPLPSRTLQTEFNRVAADMRSLEKQQATATAMAQATFDSLLTQMFKN